MSIPMEHIAVVVLCHQADKVTLRTIDTCATYFGSKRVFVLDYAVDDSFPLHASLDDNDFHAVNYVHSPEPNKHKALERMCSSDHLARYSHVLLVDHQAGARVELIQDGLGMFIDIPTCAYFAHHSIPDSMAQPKPNWLSAFLRKKPKPQNNKGLLRLKPTFAEERNENMPNHFLDLWKRSTLLLHLRNELNKDRVIMSSQFCSLQQALTRSAPYCR
jgi:hypothetical protein